MGDIRQPGRDKCSPPRRGGRVGPRVAALAAKQHGVVSARQLYALGWDREAVRREAERGFLHRMHFGAYAVGHPGLTPDGALMAAVLACGPGSVLAHRSAAAVWELRAAATPVPEVAVPRGRRARPGVRIHRPRSLPPEDVTVHRGFPVTTVTRTLVDLAADTSSVRLERLWEEAVRRGLVDVRRLGELFKGRHGTRHLRRLLARTTEPEPSRSELERLFNRECGRRGLPPPALNVAVEGLEVDAYWPDEGLVVELDSWEFHRTRAAFERDRARDARLVAAGHRVMRFTWRQLRTDAAWGRLTDAMRRR